MSFDLSLSPPAFGASTTETVVTPRVVFDISPQLSPPQPRLPTSPRIFRDLLASSSANNIARTLPGPPARFQETSQDVTGAIADASRAVQNAQHALQLPPLVDLTESSPSQSPESLFLSQTHPHDARARRTPRLPFQHSSLQTPVYGAHHGGRPTSDLILPEIRTMSPANRSHAATRIIYTGFGEYAIARSATNDEIRRDETRAIQRQRDARARWESNQRDRAAAQPQQPDCKPERRSYQSSPASRKRQSSSPEVESVDLTQVGENDTLADVLAKQRHDAILSQASIFDTQTGRSILTSFKCPICMETPKDATTTICGHLFCHRCIIDTLKWSEGQNRGQTLGKAKGVCPVCRKPLTRKDVPGTHRNLIPLELKLTVRKRKRDDDNTGKGKQRARDESESIDGAKAMKLKGKENDQTNDEQWLDLVNADSDVSI